ncbi:TIM barrel protein, partial [Butyricicoccus sp. AM27-36]
PRYVYLCFDTGHFTFSKEDAVKAAKEFGPRIGHVHLKDIRPDMMEKAYAEGFKFRKAVLEGCFTIPGDGCVDYPGVFKALHDAHYEGWFIVEAEQDPAKANPLEYAKMAREYIKKTAGI